MLNINNHHHKAKIFLFGGIFLLLLFGSNIYIKHKNQQNKLHAQQLKFAAEQEVIIRAELDNLFDVYLYNFKTDLKKAAALYKGSRKVLKEILSPYNFETPEYTKENYFFFKDHIAPDLRRKSADIIDIFQKYTDRLKEDIENKNSNIGQKFLLKWQKMSNAQLGNYVIFFTKEEQLIQAYEEIIEFYYIHSKRFSFDIENNTLLFDKKEDKDKEQYLLQKIKDI